MIKALISSIPENFRRRQIHMTGESSIKWFDELTGILEKVVNEWRLSDFRLVEEMSFNNIIFYANSPEYGDVVVKIGHPAYELFFFEREALKYYRGQSACKLYDLDSQNRAMLLERISPGEQLLEINDMKERIRIATNLLVKINMPIDEKSNFLSYEEMIPEYFQRAKTNIQVDNKLFDLINDAERLFSEIISEKYIRVLTHGDYHYRNILLSENSYKVIDPKGVAGFGFMDTARLINNELFISDDIFSISYLNQIVSLVSMYTGYNMKLLSRWLFIEYVWRTAGDTIYIKSNKKKLDEKIKRCELYLQCYRQN